MKAIPAIYSLLEWLVVYVPFNVAVAISKLVVKLYSRILLKLFPGLPALAPFTTYIFNPSGLKPNPWWKLLPFAVDSVLLKILVSGLYGVVSLYSSTCSCEPSKINILVPSLLKSKPLGLPPTEV